MVYLFVGDDPTSKDIQLRKLKSSFLPENIEQFNLDTLYARGLSLKSLQEKLFYLPGNNAKRMVVIKEAQELKEALKDFLLEYLKEAQKYVVLILDLGCVDRRDSFLNNAAKYAKVIRFKETPQLNTFTLCRLIDSKSIDAALRVLNQLLNQGERPERILGGLRHEWERLSAGPFELRRRLKLFILCDTEIKMGKLKPVFALEKLVVSLCAFVKPLH
ncbi:MAG: hypothetical protein ABSE81_02435 [Candidatus Omnitrophota bacterium]|jgi:DNA polymerase III delta subunit